MATLTNPQLKITPVSGSNQADVEASVGVGITPLEQFLIANGLGLSLRCELWGADSGFNGDDDLLSVVGVRPVPVSTTHTFKVRVPRNSERCGRELLAAGSQLRPRTRLAGVRP